MDLELVFSSVLPGFSLKSSALSGVRRDPLGNGIERWTLASSSMPVLDPTANGPVNAGAQSMPDSIPRLDATVRVEPGPPGAAVQRFRLVDGMVRVWLKASSKILVHEGAAVITAEGLLIPVPATRFFATPTGFTSTQELPLVLRYEDGWQYRLLPGRPIGWSREGSLESALRSTLDALEQIESPDGLERAIVEVKDSEWQRVPVKTEARWPSSFVLRNAVVTLSDVPLILSPDLLQLTFEGDAQLAMLRFQEGREPSGVEVPGVELSSGGLKVRETLRFVAVPATSEAPPQGPLSLWLRTDQGWLSIRTGDGSAPKPGLRWGEETGDVETREVTLESGERAGGRLSVLLDHTRTKRLDLKFPVPVAGGSASRVERSATFFDAGVRVLTPHLLSMGKGQSAPDLVPHFDEGSTPPVHEKAPRPDAFLDDGAGRRFERLMLLTEKLCTSTAGTLAATVQVVPMDSGSSPVTTGALEKGSALEIKLTPEASWVVDHHRAIPGVPSAVPVEWAANDPDAGRRPSPLRGLAPVRLDGAASVRLRVDRPWFSLSAEPGKKSLALRDKTVPWGMWPVLGKHLGLELEPAAPADKLAANIRVRHALPHLDAAYRAAGLAGLTEEARAGAERIDGEYALFGPIAIPDIDSVATSDLDGAPAPGGAEDPLEWAAHMRAFDPAGALDAAPRDGKSDRLITLLVEARNTTVDPPMSVPVFRMFLWLRGQSIRTFSVVGPDGRTPKLFGGHFLPIDVWREGDVYKIRASYGPFAAIPPSDLLFEVGVAESGTAPLRAVRGTLAIPAGIVLNMLPDTDGVAPNETASLLFFESSSMKHEVVPVNGTPTLQLLARDLQCTVRCGTEIFRSATKSTLVLSGVTATFRAPEVEDPHRTLTATLAEISLTLTHRLPGLEIREICGTSGYRMEVQAGAAKASFAEGSGPPDPSTGISVTKSYQRVFVTGAPVAATFAEPVRPVPEWNVEARALTRCHVLLTRRGEGLSNGDLLQLDRGVLGYTAGRLFGAEPDGDGPLAAQITLTVPGGRATPSLSFSGVWRHTRAVRINGAPSQTTMTLALWESASGDVARARAARLPVTLVPNRPGAVLEPERDRASFELIVRHEIKAGQNPRWIALQTARIQSHVDTMDLSATHALAAYPADTPPATLASRRPGLVLGLCPPPAPGSHVKTALVRLPASTSAELLVIQAPASTTAHHPSVTTPDVGVRPWLPGPEGDAVSLSASVAGDGLGPPWESAVDGPDGLILGDLMTASAWAGHTLYRREARSDTVWVSSGLCSLDLRSDAVDPSGPVVWVFGEAGLHRLHTFPAPASADPKPPIQETTALLTAARWHEVAVLEWRDGKGKVRWDLVDSPLLDRFKNLDSVTFAGTLPGRPPLQPSPRKMPELPTGHHLALGGDCQLDCQLPPLPGQRPTAEMWIPPYVGLDMRIQLPPQAGKFDTASLTLDRSTPFLLDQTHPLTPCDPFDATTVPLPIPKLTPTPGVLPCTPTLVALSPYAPRPSERTGFGVALTVMSTGKSVLVSRSPSAVLRAPPAFDEQSPVRVEVSSAEDRFDRKDGLVTRAVRWIRRHPAAIDLADPKKPVALALGSPEARVSTGAPVRIRLLVNRDNLKRYYDANKPADVGNNAVSIVLVLTKTEGKDDVEMGTSAAAGGVFRKTLKVPLLRVDIPAESSPIEVTFRDSAEGQWTSDLLLSYGAKAISWSAASASGAPSLLVTRTPPPRALTGVLRTGRLDRRKLVAYGPDAIDWRADIDPASTSPRGLWEASSQVLDRTSDKDDLLYEVVSLMSDGSFSASEAVTVQKP